jgi:alkylated DNA repair dioxygenase AlkB
VVQPRVDSIVAIYSTAKLDHLSPFFAIRSSTELLRRLHAQEFRLTSLGSAAVTDHQFMATCCRRETHRRIRMNIKSEHESRQLHENASRKGWARNTSGAASTLNSSSSSAIGDAPDRDASGPRSRKNGGRTKRTRMSWSEVPEDFVPGLSIFRWSIDKSLQEALVQWINAEGRWAADHSRWRQWHALQYLYKKDVLSPEGDGSLPAWLLDLARFVCDRGRMSAVARQVTVQKYGVGSFIGPHVDSRRCFPAEIVTVSLVSAATFRMTDKRNGRRFTTVLQPGDVVVLRGDARNVWKHEILKCKPPDNEDPASWYRLSITFRNTNPERVRQ